MLFIFRPNTAAEQTLIKSKCTSEGVWTDALEVVCSKVKCVKAPVMENAVIIQGRSDVYNYQHKIVFQCNKGYDAGPKTITTTCQVCFNLIILFYEFSPTSTENLVKFD